MGGDNGKKIAAIIIVIALLGIFYFWYTGGGLGGISLGRPSYQPLGGISPMAAPDAKAAGKEGAGLGGIAAFWPILLIPLLSKILSGSFNPLNTFGKTSLKLEPASATIKPNERKTLTATLKFGGGSPWKRRVKFRIEQAPEGGHTMDASLSDAEKRTNGHGQATTEIKAGEEEGTLKVTAEYKGILIRGAKAESEINISSRAREPEHPPPRRANLDAVKEHIKEKIAGKTISQLALAVSDRSAFKECLFSIPEFSSLPDEIIRRLLLSAFQGEGEIADKFNSNRAELDQAIESILSMPWLETLINNNRETITNRCARRGGEEMPQIDTYHALSDTAVLKQYENFGNHLRPNLRDIAQENNFVMWKLFGLNKFDDFKDYLNTGYAEMEEKHPLSDLPAVVSALANAGIPAEEQTKELWNQLAARVIISYYLEGGGAQQPARIPVGRWGKLILDAGMRPEKVLGKLKLVDSFLTHIAPSRGYKLKPLSHAAFVSNWKEYQPFFKDYEGITRQGYLVREMDYPPEAQPEQFKGTQEKIKAKAYLVYCLLANHYNYKDRLETLKNISNLQKSLERELGIINSRIRQDYKKVTSEEQQATESHKANRKRMATLKTRIYKDLCSKKQDSGSIRVAWGMVRQLTADTNAAADTPPRKSEFENAAKNEEFELLEKQDIVTREDIGSAVNIAHLIANAIYAITIRSATALKLYAYILAKFAASMKTPAIKPAEEVSSIIDQIT